MHKGASPRASSLSSADHPVQAARIQPSLDFGTFSLCPAVGWTSVGALGCHGCFCSCRRRVSEGCTGVSDDMGKMLLTCQLPENLEVKSSAQFGELGKIQTQI